MRRKRTPFGPRFLIIFFWSCQILAASTTTETYKDIIDKALHHSLQKDRTQAVQVLVKSIQKESKKASPPKDLLSTLDEVATIFYSDKAQQLFELAISLKTTNPSVAQQRLGEALRLEPENLSVELEQARIHILTGDCSKAESIATRLQQQIPYLESIHLLAAQAAVCQGQLEKVAEARQNIDVKKSSLNIFWSSTEADQALRSGQPQKALDTALSMQKAAPQFPESFYWQWRAETELKKNPEKAGQTYLNNCKTLSPRHFREYLAEPMLCRRLAEVETALKKINSDQVK